jgi:hypothetical protein
VLIDTIRLIAIALLTATSFCTGISPNRASLDGSTYYVDGDNANASDTGDAGTQEKPWKTIVYALQQLGPGDKLFIRGGVYSEAYCAGTSHGGTAEAPITVAAFPGEEVVWRNGTNSNLWLMKGPYWIIDGITFEGRLIMGESEVEPAEHITIRNATFRNSPHMGAWLKFARYILIEKSHFVNIRSNVPGEDSNAVSIRGWADEITIRDSRFEDIGSDGIHIGGFDDQIGRVVIENNEFFISGTRSPVGENGVDIKGVQGPVVIAGNKFHGFRATVSGQDASGALGSSVVLHERYSDGPAARNVTVERNLFYDNEIHLTAVHGTRDIVVRNNIFRDAHWVEGYPHGDSGTALLVYDNVQNVEFVNNTLFGNKCHVRGYDGSVSGILENNVFWQGGLCVPGSGTSWTWTADYNGWAGIEDGVPSYLRGSHDVVKLDLGLANDLKPAVDSPLIDAGDQLGIAEDFEGNARSDGTPDIGAFEFVPILSVEPSVQSIPPGGVAQYRLRFNSRDADDALTLSATSSDTALELSLDRSVIRPGQAATLTVIDRHSEESAGEGLWRTISIASLGSTATLKVDVQLLVGGSYAFLPLAGKNRVTNHW